MIAFIKGVLEQKEPNRAIIDVNGIGYEVLIPISTYEALPDTGEPVKLYTYQLVRESEMSLFGFLTKDELTVFKLVLTVSGVGPKAALGILSKITPSQFRSAILKEDVGRLRSAPGIGARTAQRLILELKDKVQTLPEEAEGEPGKEAAKVTQAIAALVELGSNRRVAENAVYRAVKILGREARLEEIIRLALRFVV
ncbi:TPA: Holliday junction branch migration protein RuvA [Candidatus Poribacteria bacterium]|nr:Holliday junction branch migration protein RuvA [Candidatus Poribacteria bacterium]